MQTGRSLHLVEKKTHINRKLITQPNKADLTVTQIDTPYTYAVALLYRH